jgi:hypothetical protein
MYTPNLGFKKVYTPYIGQAHTPLNYEVLRHPHLYSMLVHTYTHSYIPYEVLRHPHLYSMLVHTYTHSYIPYGVLEAVVGGSREDKVCSSQLLNVAEPLELRGVDDTDQQRMHLYMAMDGVIKHLQETIIYLIVDTTLPLFFPLWNRKGCSSRYMAVVRVLLQ